MGVEKLKLKRNHTWKSKPGYSICVIDRGLVRFDYPSEWKVEPGEGAVHLHDQAPSVESCDLGVSIFHVPPELVHELSLDETLRDTLEQDRKAYADSEIRHISRGDLEISWIEQRYTEEEYKRDARLRVALARGPVFCLLTMNYWANRAEELEPAWDEVLRTLVIGQQVDDPTSGPVIH
jgi:hypothetical protein